MVNTPFTVSSSEEIASDPSSHLSCGTRIKKIRSHTPKIARNRKILLQFQQAQTVAPNNTSRIYPLPVGHCAHNIAVSRKHPKPHRFARRLWVSISALNRIRYAARTVACSLALSDYESRENVPSCYVFTVFGVFCFLCDCTGCRPTPGE